MAAFIADRIVRCHLKTMRRLNIGYDLLTWEGDILRLHFWAHAFEFLKKTGEVYLQTEGKLAGCWVMKIDDEPDAGSGKPDAGSRKPEAGSGETDSEEHKEKVIVRSDGTVTYVGKDMAYQMWKFGVLGKDFHYRVFDRDAAGPPLFSTTSDPAADVPDHPAFGRATMVCNVIDTRQAYLQKLLKQALAALGFEEQARRSVHYSYEMVALTHSTARELGYEAAEDGGQAVRRGVGPQGARRQGRRPDRSADRQGRGRSRPAQHRVHGGGRAPDGGNDRHRRGPLLHGEVLARQGDRLRHRRGAQLRGGKRSLPAVRRGPRQQHLREAEGTRRHRRGRRRSRRCPSLATDAIADGSDDSHELWGLVLEAARLDEVVDKAVRTLELSVVAKYAFGLAQQFNGFYHAYPMLKEERRDVRLWRAAAIAYYRQQLTRALDLMGCTVPERM